MRIFLICVLLCGVALAIWVLAGRRLVTLLDRVTLAPIERPVLEHVVYDLGSLQMGGKHLDLMNPAYAWAADVTLDSSGRAVLESGGRRFAFGPGHSLSSNPGVRNFEFEKDPGDEASLIVERSRLSWPTPFEMNFMTGYAPSRKRNVYFRLRWTKRSGAKLTIDWKTEQNYYRRDGWMPPVIEAVAGGLTRIDIHVR